MSGLAGFAGYCGNDSPGLLERMSSSMRRSPLSFHQWGNGSAGISVADHQESDEHNLLFNEDHSVCIAMNGEVFGFDRERRELKTSGHLFKGEANGAEYCLHLYEEKGPAAFCDLNGDFVLVIFDLKKDVVYLISDKFSSYALFYSLAQRRDAVVQQPCGFDSGIVSHRPRAGCQRDLRILFLRSDLYDEDFL